MGCKKILLLAVFSFTSNAIAAQEVGLEMKQDSVILTTQEKHAALLEAYINYNKARGDYRIQIMSGSLERANQALENLDEAYADWPHSIDYVPSSFRLRIGNFKTRLEAERMLIAVRKKYPAAVLLKPQLLVKNN